MSRSFVINPDVPKESTENCTIKKTSRGYTMGFDPVVVPAGESRKIPVSCDVPWRADTFFVAEEVADKFELLSAVVARIEFVPRSPIPCELFSTAACAVCQKEKISKLFDGQWPIVYPGSILYVVIRNRSGQEYSFRGGFTVELDPTRDPHPAALAILPLSK